jgi:hypothetical protein
VPPLNLYARVRIFLCILHTRPRVQRASGIPCSLFEGENVFAKLGQLMPREGEAMFGNGCASAANSLHLSRLRGRSEVDPGNRTKR